MGLRSSVRWRRGWASTTASFALAMSLGAVCGCASDDESSDEKPEVFYGVAPADDDSLIPVAVLVQGMQRADFESLRFAYCMDIVADDEIRDLVARVEAIPEAQRLEIVALEERDNETILEAVFENVPFEFVVRVRPEGPAEPCVDDVTTESQTSWPLLKP